MRKKIFSAVIIIILILSSIMITKIYADDSSTVVSIPETSLKPGDQMKVYINVENITTYTLSQIVLTTDIYLEPVIDVATTGMTISDSAFDPLNKTFTIQNIPAGVNTICVLYTIPSYIVGGTPINVTYALSDDQGTQQEANNIQVTVVANNTTNQNTTNNTGTGDATGADGTGTQQQNTPNGQNNTNNSTKNNMNSGTNNTRSNSGSSNSTNRSQSTGMGASSFSGSGASNAQTVTYLGSRNNYLSNLTVKGYSLTPKFNKTNNTYFITVGNGVKSVTVTATKEDSSAVVTISGNTSLQVGLNKVLISVLAKNGDVRYYRIYVERI